MTGELTFSVLNPQVIEKRFQDSGNYQRSRFLRILWLFLTVYDCNNMQVQDNGSSKLVSSR